MFFLSLLPVVYWSAFLLSLPAIEDEGGNPDEIEVTSECNKKMPKRPSKGKESLNHCVSALGTQWVQSLLSLCHTESEHIVRMDLGMVFQLHIASHYLVCQKIRPMY